MFFDAEVVIQHYFHSKRVDSQKTESATAKWDLQSTLHSKNNHSLPRARMNCE